MCSMRDVFETLAEAFITRILNQENNSAFKWTMPTSSPFVEYPHDDRVDNLDDFKKHKKATKAELAT